MTRNRRAKGTPRSKEQSGSTLIELLVAMTILAVGLGALTPIFTGAILNDTRSSKDTTATMLSQKVVEELTAQDTNSTVALTLTDCAGNTWTVPSTQGASYSSGGQGAALATSSSSPYYGGIDFTQSLSSVPAGFSMQYVDCDVNGAQTTYDVRWNIVSISSNNTRMVTASAQRMGNSSASGFSFNLPVTLRAIGGA